MSDEILVNITPQETRVAVVENGVVQEVIIERTRKKGLVGNIYKGEISRVLPGMQAAFVDIGLERGAFLHVSDLSSKDTQRLGTENIDHLLSEHLDIVVQVIKDPLGTKGARLTTELSIPSRYTVYMPYSPTCGISQRIESEQERTRLKDCMDRFQSEFNTGAFIARTAAECVEEDVLRTDMMFLI
ncbi:MAG: ribonuclease E/G, partial [Methylococcales bacterium]